MNVHRKSPLLQPMVLMALTSAIFGCSTVNTSAVKQAEVAVVAHATVALPTIALLPHALGYSLSEQQQIVVVAPDGRERHLHALLEVDAQQVRLALSHMGQTMASLIWDGQQLKAQRSPYLPPDVKPERVLTDLQLALWPLPSITSALPADWQVQGNEDGSRGLWHEGVEHIRITSLPSSGIQISYVQQGWKLKVVSPSLQARPAQGGKH